MANFIHGLELTLVELIALAKSDGIQLTAGQLGVENNFTQLTRVQATDLVQQLQAAGFLKWLKVVLVNPKLVYLGVGVTTERFPTSIEQWPKLLQDLRVELTTLMDANHSKEQLMRIAAKNNKIVNYYTIPYGIGHGH